VPTNHFLRRPIRICPNPQIIGVPMIKRYARLTLR
jgi:hypothetical protein